jgi:hypothetical protein
MLFFVKIFLVKTELLEDALSSRNSQLFCSQSSERSFRIFKQSPWKVIVVCGIYSLAYRTNSL